MKQAQELTKQSEAFFEKHHRIALSITFFQIAIALSAITALLKQKSFWYASMALTVVGLVLLFIGIK